MAKKAKRRRPRSSRNVPPPDSHDLGNGNSAEVATVAWMLSLLATLIAQILGIVTRLLMMQAGISDRLRVLSGTLLIVALVAGFLTLIMTPVTLKLRRVPPPRPIVVSAVIVGLIPLVTVLILVWR